MSEQMLCGNTAAEREYSRNQKDAPEFSDAEKLAKALALLVPLLKNDLVDTLDSLTDHDQFSEYLERLAVLAIKDDELFRELGELALITYEEEIQAALEDDNRVDD